ncbi:MAG: siphovirus ReqiPepy6 Gp37-like family protein [Faecalibacterium sp.]
MKLDVLEEQSLIRVGCIDVWVSLYWDEPYRSAGEFTLEVRPTDENLALLQQGRWLVRTGSDIPMRICARSNANEDANLVVSGYPAAWILTRRVSTSIVQNENAEEAMRKLVSEMSPWERLELGEAQGYDTVFSAQVSGGSIFDYCQTICAACDLGFRIRMDGKGAAKRLLFEVYRPDADLNHRFSPAFGNLLNASWQFADTNLSNVAIVQGAGSGEARVTVTVGETALTGCARREMYVDARDLQPDETNGETAGSLSYLQRLQDRGGARLLEQLRTGSIEFDVEDDTLMPGDVIFASLPKLGYKATVRVADVILQSQADGTTRTLRLGTPSWQKL